MKRQVSGLIFARALAKRPSCIPIGRPRGQKAWGIKYEREIAKRLPNAVRGLWFEFEDRFGRGFCEVDFAIQAQNVVIILESKYTWTLAAHVELETLYIPVVKLALKRPVYSAVICKVLTSETARYARIVSDNPATIPASENQRVVWHFLGGMGAYVEPCVTGSLSAAEMALGF